MKTRVSKITNLIFSLSFCLALQACNKEDFYEKEFLDNPFQDKPIVDGSTNGGDHGGPDTGVDGGSQGGTDSGATDGGTSGSTTGSSTSGGTDGSTTGGSNGGVDGSTSGGATTGGVDGSTTSGGSTGATTGGTDGSTTGGTTGSTTGGSTGETTGGSTGETTGGSTGETTGGSTGETTGGSTGGTTGSTGGGSTGGSYGDCNNGHGNDADGVDESNPTIGLDPKCKMESFRQARSQTKKLDIVWIIDNSGSMSDEQTALGTNFSAFINEFINKDVDFKMAITTTDATSSNKGKMVYGSDTKLTSAKARQNEAQFKSDFRNLVQVGTRGSGYEKGLEASEGFMQRYASTFLRSDAYLAVVVLSDEEDQSAKNVSFYTDYLKSFKNEAGLVKVYTIADINKTNRGQGISTGADRYINASEETAGVVANIRDDFHMSLSEMGDSIINLLDSFALASNPVPGTLKVYVNNVETTDYTYDAASRSIKFDSSRLPPVGAEIKVYYIKQ